MLNFIIWVILIYFALLLIWRYLVPLILRRTLRKFERKYKDYSDQQNYDESKEGEVKIDHIPPKDTKPAEPSSDIEYTDFEDIKDTDEH